MFKQDRDDVWMKGDVGTNQMYQEKRKSRWSRVSFKF